LDKHCIDLSHTRCAVRSTTGRGWLGTNIRDDQWLVNFNAAASQEIETLARFLEANPLPLLQRQLHETALPQCSALIQQMRDHLNHGVGFSVLDRLPIDHYEENIVTTIYWLLEMIGRPVAQKWNGEMIYDVTDKGIAWGYGVRGSHTSVELVFHTDNAFAKCVPDYVGLLCKQPAKTGGISRFCSFYTVHERVQQASSSALERLYQPMFFDRQKEHAATEAPVTWAPWFCWKSDRLQARANSMLVRKGYDVAGQDMDRELEDALALVDDICADPTIWFEAPLSRGQVQYLNNHEIGHYRSEFIDFDEPERKRHLVRLWHREQGSTAYDGEFF